MSTYDPLGSHKVHTSLENALRWQADEGLLKKVPSLPEDQKWALQRVFVIINDAKTSLSKMNPRDVNLSALDGLAAGLDQVHTQLQSYSTNNNAGHITNARTQAENSVLSNLKNLLPIGFPVHPKTEAALEAYQAKFADARKQSTAEVQDIQKALMKLHDQIDAKTAELEVLEKSIVERHADNDSALEKLRTADEARVKSMSEESNNAIATANKTVSEFVSAQRKKLSKTMDESSGNLQNLIKEVEGKRDEARQIVESVGVLLTTGTYADRANTETDKADVFRYLTVGLFGCGLLIIISNYLIFALGSALGIEVNLSESWQSLLARTATGLAFALPAFYTARESARHRTNADVAKQRELELSTLGPFIELLPEDQKAQIRDRLTDRYFGGEVEPHEFKPPIDPQVLVKAFAEAASKAGQTGS